MWPASGWVPPTIPDAHVPIGQPAPDARAGDEAAPAAQADLPADLRGGAAAGEGQEEHGRAPQAAAGSGLTSGGEPAGQQQLAALLAYGSDSDAGSGSEDSGGAAGARPQFESFF